MLVLEVGLRRATVWARFEAAAVVEVGPGDG